MINLPGCTKPASGLYEARAIPYEVHRIRSAAYGLLQSMRKLNFRPRANPYGSKIVQNIVRARTAYLAITQMVLHVIFMWPGHFNGDDELMPPFKLQNRRWDIPRCDCVHRSFSLFRDQ